MTEVRVKDFEKHIDKTYGRDDKAGYSGAMLQLAYEYGLKSCTAKKVCGRCEEYTTCETLHKEFLDDIKKYDARRTARQS